VAAPAVFVAVTDTSTSPSYFTGPVAPLEFVVAAPTAPLAPLEEKLK
jgi:hypothetical protein